MSTVLDFQLFFERFLSNQWSIVPPYSTVPMPT